MKTEDTIKKQAQSMRDSRCYQCPYQHDPDTCIAAIIGCIEHRSIDEWQDKQLKGSSYENYKYN